MQQGGRFTKDDGDKLKEMIGRLDRRMWECGCGEFGAKRFKLENQVNK